MFTINHHGTPLKNAQVEVRDYKNQLVHLEKWSSWAKEKSISLKGFAKGVYSVTLRSDNHWYVKKVVIQ
jgi:hypothetical protein